MQTVLVVEDQEEVRAVLSRMLERLGYMPLTAADGEQALRVARGTDATIHLMLTDVVMPGMSAVDLTKQISAERIGLRTIYMSGYPEDVLGEHLGSDGSSAVLLKPFNQDQLHDAIQNLIGAAQRPAR